jgi:predicted nucleic acid-binding protein
MKVLVDTPIWSQVFRRKKNTDIAPENILEKELTELIRELRAVIIGPIRQEVLSGISNESQFKKLRKKLRVFENLEIVSEDYERAAEFYNQCRRKGIQGSHIDFLICAAANRNGIPIFTTDKDFELYSKHINISLYEIRSGFLQSYQTREGNDD